MPDLLTVELWRDWYMVTVRHNHETFMHAAHPDELLGVIARTLREAVNRNEVQYADF